MDNVKMILNEDGYYRPRNQTSLQLGILGSFLAEDVNEIKSWIDWIEDVNDQTGRSGNETSLDKITGDYIVMGYGFMDTYNGFDTIPDYMLMIKISELTKLLKKWADLKSKKIKHIIITKNGDVFDMHEIV